MKHFRMGLALLLCLTLFVSLSGSAFAADPRPYALSLQVDGSARAVRAFDESYEGNPYLCLSDLSAALNGTAKQFSFRFHTSGSEGDQFFITLGAAAETEARTEEAMTRSSPLMLNLKRNRLYVDESERKYYTYRAAGNELYMSLTDVQLMLDLAVQVSADGQLHVFTDRSFSPDVEALDALGYFDVFNGIVLADADTGRTLYSKGAYTAYPVASLSKLMGYLLLAEARDAGTISFEDTVTVSDKAYRLSLSPDGIIFLSYGSQLPFQELLGGMMLASSNECALALAEHTYGSEEAFVAQMNSRAKELGLRTAQFYTLHGLPSYSKSAQPVKLQNLMSARDVFQLARYLLTQYPELTDLCSKPYLRMPKLDYTTANSNPLVFNLPGVNGLKTGSTNAAGYCLAASLPVTVGEETHTVVLVLLGAESAELRGQAAEILLRYARDYYTANGFGAEG